MNANLAAWVAHVFDHPVAEREWHGESDSPTWESTAADTAALIAETFERAEELMAGFSDEQVNQGLSYLLSGNGCLFTLCRSEVAMPIRKRAMRSLVPLFEQVMSVRCANTLSHLDEPGGRPLNGLCYMWWDIGMYLMPKEDAQLSEFDLETLSVMRRILAIPHDACRESALHGLGHWDWGMGGPDTSAIIADFLSRTPSLRPELIRYAECAQIGYVN
jgi:hypothetical protein